MNNLLKSKKMLAALSVAAAIAIVLPLAVNAAVTNQTPVGVVGTLKFQGSTTIGPIIQRAAADYNSYRGVTVITNDSANIAQPGSGDGQKATVQLFTDIGMSSGNLPTTAGSGVLSPPDR